MKPTWMAAAVMEEDKRRQEIEAEMAASNTVQGAQSEHVSGSRMALDDQDEMMAAALLKKGKAGTVSRRGSGAPPPRGPAAGAAGGLKMNLKAKAPGTPGSSWEASWKPIRIRTRLDSI